MDDSDDKKEISTEEQAFYDGDCPMCRNFAAQHDDTGIAMRNFRTEQLPEQLSANEVEAAIHYRDSAGKLHRGADAVLRIMAKRSRLAPLFTVLMLPPAIWVARLVYAIISRNRFALYGDYARVTYVKLVATLAFILPMLVSFRLWHSEQWRTFPTAPLFSFLPTIPAPIDSVIWLTLIALLFWALLSPRPTKSLFSFLVLGICYSLFDCNRMMPYYVELFWIVSLMAVFPWPRERRGAVDAAATRNTLSAVGIVLIGIWFWSGLHKLNITYLMVGFPWLIEPMTNLLNPKTAATINSLAILTPLIESFAAAALLARTTRTLGVILLTLMHVFILLMLGPFGHNFNHSVWSWNIAHIALAWIVFYRSPVTSESLLRSKQLLHIVVAAWFLLLPAGAMFGVWPRSLSYSLYTWAGSTAVIASKDSSTAVFPKELRSLLTTTSEGEVVLDIQDWAYRDISSPPFDYTAVYFQAFKKVCDGSEDPEALELQVSSSPDAVSGKRSQHRYSCSNVP